MDGRGRRDELIILPLWPDVHGNIAVPCIDVGSAWQKGGDSRPDAAFRSIAADGAAARVRTEPDSKTIGAATDYSCCIQSFPEQANGWEIGTGYVKMDRYYTASCDTGAVKAAVEDSAISREKNTDIEKSWRASVASGK